MKRVLLVITGLPEQSGGAQMRALRHARYLNSRPDCRAAILACATRPDVIASDVQQSPNPEITPLRLLFRPHNQAALPLQAVFLILHLAECYLRLGWFFLRRRRQYDLVHAFGTLYWFNLVALQVAGWFKLPSLLEMIGVGHDPLSLNKRAGQPGRQALRHLPLRYRLFLKASAYISKSDQISQSYRQAGLPEEDLFQVPSGVDTNIYQPPADGAVKAALRQKLDLPPAAPLFVFSGRLSKEKGLHWLLPAFRDLLAQQPEARLLLLGSPLEQDRAYAAQRQAEVQTWGLGESIRFAGRVANVVEYLQAADVFVLTGTYEGFSNAILEAMACRLPIIAFDSPGVTGSQINHLQEGWLAAIGDIPGLTAAMQALLADPALAARLAEAAYQRAQREFTLAAVGRRYLEIYQHLTSLSAQSATP